MRLLSILAAAAALAIGPAAYTPCLDGAAYAAGACCKRCSKGKAYGDSCIAADKGCRKGKGCACNG